MEAKERLERLGSARRNIVPGIPSNPSIEELMEWIHARGNVENIRCVLTICVTDLIFLILIQGKNSSLKRH